MDIQQAVAENIHRIRKAQKLSIDRAAELSGVSKSMWGQIERGLANPTVSVLSRVALGLHVPLEQLIAWRTGTACPSPAVSPIAMKTSATTRSGLSSGSCIKNEASRQTTGQGGAYHV